MARFLLRVEQRVRALSCLMLERGTWCTRCEPALLETLKKIVATISQRFFRTAISLLH